MITYATKCWSGDYDKVWSYHPNADLVVGNNMSPDEIKKARKIYKDKFVYAGEGHAYTLGERFAVDNIPTGYILWYAGDVTPPKEDWTKVAIKLLDKYPIVSPFMQENWENVVGTATREQYGGFELTDFGYEDHFFSDHAYFAKVSTMKNIDYELDHPIKTRYPSHGENSFERRVAQWLSVTGNKRAVLKDFRYRHTPNNEK